MFVQDVVCDAARELVESIGAHDPLTSSQYLALYQVSKLVYRVRFWDHGLRAVLGSWRLDTSAAVKNSFTRYHVFLRAVSCYVDKLKEK